MALVVGTNSYVSISESIVFFLDTLRNARWTSVDVNTKSAALIDATRYLERLDWIGTRTVSTQALSWPRSGVSDREGLALDSSVVPSFIKEATYEIALRLAEDPDLIDNFLQQTRDNTKRVRAGNVEAEFFVPTNGTPIFEWLVPLLRPYLRSATGISGNFASGINNTSSFTSGQYDRSEGLA